eukprot:PITA_31847
MGEEYDSIVNNSVWEVVPRPEKNSMVGFRWLYKVKHEGDGSIENSKAGFVAKGFSQLWWRIHQMDIKIAFFNGVVEEEIHIDHLEGFETFVRETHVCRLRRALYGIKQAPCPWYTSIDSHLICLGFNKSESDANLYYILVEGNLFIIVLHVDDLRLAWYEKLIESYKEDLAKEFNVKEMGLMHYFLGLEVWQGDVYLFVEQGKYTYEILHRFHMQDCNPMDTHLATNWRKDYASIGEVVDSIIYRQLVYSLMYLVNTRTNICFSVN